MSRTDRLLAELERGFEALEDGKIEAAAAILERCRRIDRKNPDVVALGAAVADLGGETEEAIAQYRKLIELRPDDPMPRICVARIELEGLADPDSALETVERAFDFIDEEADLIAAICVKTEALIARGELTNARHTLAELSSSAIDDPDLTLELADLAIAAEDPAGATRWIESARKLAKETDDPGLEADALHALGRVHELTGDRPAMVAAWKEVLRLDRLAPPGHVHVSEDELERLASAALAELPPKIHARLADVPILIHDLPEDGFVEDGLDPRLLGLFQGASMPDGSTVTPTITNILLFKRNLEGSARDLEHLADEIRITVLHETAHYFGLDEDDLEKLGLD
jgi:predicted Zn-dependent protease with MMP-like domain/Flp pilus assembly protein TadD